MTTVKMQRKKSRLSRKRHTKLKGTFKDVISLELKLTMLAIFMNNTVSHFLSDNLQDSSY